MSNIRRKTSLVNFVELGRRTWEFFNQDHLLATLLSIFTSIFIRWFLTQDASMLPAFAYASFALVGITGLKYRYDLVNRKQSLIEAERDTKISMEKIDKHFQMKVITTMLGMSYESGVSVLKHSLTHIEKDNADVGVLKTLTSVVIDSQNFIADKVKLIDMPYKNFVTKFFGGDQLETEEPTLDNLPPIDSKELLSQLQSSISIDPKEIDQKTKDIDDFHPNTNES